jgi:hypothetical protein
VIAAQAIRELEQLMLPLEDLTILFKNQHSGMVFFPAAKYVILVRSLKHLEKAILDFIRSLISVFIPIGTAGSMIIFGKLVILCVEHMPVRT